MVGGGLKQRRLNSTNAGKWQFLPPPPPPNESLYTVHSLHGAVACQLARPLTLRRPHRALSSVDLPQPFAPTRPTR